MNEFAHDAAQRTDRSRSGSYHDLDEPDYDDHGTSGLGKQESWKHGFPDNRNPPDPLVQTGTNSLEIRMRLTPLVFLVSVNVIVCT